ncbi:hypothetical protein PHLCEN_2v11338 [Hermanssonia centrifuga]|uniref:Uncharacterized protein n=1 Tax=Hermanssonia centrifuga TaxID=98765 RepID=A0A2R6NK64_9APHY|nr:hypothetical protein PHLCEN_2v11338 [Hermanssonia centrifuga]
MNAPDAEVHPTEQKNVVALRRAKPLSAFKLEGWDFLLESTGLLEEFGEIPQGLRIGFIIGTPVIRHTIAPHNSPSLSILSEQFASIISNEFRLNRYLGPFTRIELKNIIGHFQTSPMSLIPKPHKPGAFRLGAVRDVSEAYRNIPLHTSQWASTVVRLSEKDEFAIDTQAAFGVSSNAGMFGFIADGLNSIMRRKGIGPLSKWVDDHGFFRVLKKYLQRYNDYRAQCAKRAEAQGGKHHVGGRIFWSGDIMANDSIEEFVEDMRYPILDLSQRSPRSEEDAKFSYNLDDIDWISDQLGVPWQLEKDQLWSSTITFIGFEWNLQSKTVGIGNTKKEKYRAAIAAWRQSRMHMLKEVQKLYGKLLHASLVVQEGRAYLTGLECTLSIYHDAPFKPRTPPRAVPGDLAWWEETLRQPILVRPVPGPVPVVEIQAFSDASSGVGIGICIQDRWRAWKLIGNWKADKRDIGWAEAVGFEFLVQTIVEAGASKRTFRVYGDNKGVVEGWANGRSRNPQVNGVFKRVHKLLGLVICKGPETLQGSRVRVWRVRHTLGTLRPPKTPETLGGFGPLERVRVLEGKGKGPVNL